MYLELYQGCTFHCLVEATIKIPNLQKFLRASEHFLSEMDLKGWKSCSLVGMQVVRYMQVTPAYDQHNTVILRMAAPLPNRPLHHYCEKTTYKAIRQPEGGGAQDHGQENAKHHQKRCGRCDIFTLLSRISAIKEEGEFQFISDQLCFLALFSDCLTTI